MQHTDDTQRQIETESPSTSQVEQNQVFSGLWLQAASGNLGRRVDRARNVQGQRALKFRTLGFHKALIVEANQRPGFIVRLYDFPKKSGLIDSNGAVTFANPVETEILLTLLNQIDRWASSFEILYGEVGDAIVAQTDPENTTTTTNCERSAVADHEYIPDRLASSEIVSEDEWDNMDGSRNTKE